MERLLAHKAIRHWREWLPNRYAELLETNQLAEAADAAAKGAAMEIRALMNAGARRDEAEEVVLPKWILLPPEESEMETAQDPESQSAAIADWLNREPTPPLFKD